MNDALDYLINKKIAYSVGLGFVFVCSDVVLVNGALLMLMLVAGILYDIQ